MAQDLAVGKNKLWMAYQDAGPLKRAEVLVELKKQNLYRHFQTVASKESHDLKNAKSKLRDIFLELMPETATLFGLPPIKTAQAKKPKPVEVRQPTLFD